MLFNKLAGIRRAVFQFISFTDATEQLPSQIYLVGLDRRNVTSNTEPAAAIVEPINNEENEGNPKDNILPLFWYSWYSQCLCTGYVYWWKSGSSWGTVFWMSFYFFIFVTSCVSHYNLSRLLRKFGPEMSKSLLFACSVVWLSAIGFLLLARDDASSSTSEDGTTPCLIMAGHSLYLLILIIVAFIWKRFSQH